ncbi:hypothetical protein HPB50_007763 [Hyalomma asiaticum]|uniref:Uncharacterized protein n=1 Tax=Hyalomma asiaticum TaxID=266040 RepID=A0ACB7S216_HYAAI|nr:hypothetical protein HPB50_007763 [Hyalomma asiaticum]
MVYSFHNQLALTLLKIPVPKDLYVPVFKLDARIPEEKRDTFRNECRALLEEKTTATAEGCSMRHSFVVVHLEKASS